VVLAVCRPVLQKKGCCEACVVPVAICKTMQVAANLALPKDVVVEIAKSDGFVKKSDICVTLHPSSLRRTVSTPPSSGFASLDLELLRN
jgi:spore maturation protein SpmB